MREIKFRAYNPRDKKIHYDITGIEIYENGKMSGVFIDGAFFLTEEVNLMQYTGLKDKNGKEIYEGDILRIKNSLIELEGEVIWDTIDLSFEVYDKENDCKEMLWYTNKEFEVLGNIYENPELLKEH